MIQLASWCDLAAFSLGLVSSEYQKKSCFIDTSISPPPPIVNQPFASV